MKSVDLGGMAPIIKRIGEIQERLWQLEVMADTHRINALIRAEASTKRQQNSRAYYSRNRQKIIVRASAYQKAKKRVRG